jgi:hypothetical protein
MNRSVDSVITWLPVVHATAWFVLGVFAMIASLAMFASKNT